MSGGAFNYNDYHITGVADQIEEIIRNNEDNPEYGELTIQRYREAVKLLREASVYVHRIDWLLSGDDGEDTFHKRLERDLERLKEDG
jgi:hypothetical protein